MITIPTTATIMFNVTIIFIARIIFIVTIITMMIRECISLHIGQAGCQIGQACWELYG